MKKLIVLTAICLTLTACGSKNAADASSSATKNTSVPTTAVTEPETTAAADIILTVYSPSDDWESFVKAEIRVDAVNETIITEHLILANVLSEDTAVNSLELDGTQLNVDFNSAFRDLILTQGSTGEHAIMGSVVNTFLAAYNAETMSITVDGEILESGHVVYDEPLSFYE